MSIQPNDAAHGHSDNVCKPIPSNNLCPLEHLTSRMLVPQSPQVPISTPEQLDLLCWLRHMAREECPP